MNETSIETAPHEAEEAEREQLEQHEPIATDAELELERELEEAEEAEEAPPAREPRQPPSDVIAERAYTQLEKAAAKYTREVEKANEAAELGLVPCPLCPIPGYVIVPTPPDMPEEVVLAVQSYLGGGVENEPRQHPDLETCPTCDGWGDMRTGARRGDVLVKCPACGGRGYRDLRQERELAAMNGAGELPPPAYPAPTPTPAVAPPAGSQVSQGGFTFVPVPGAAMDPHGRVAGHPLWGLPAEAGGL